MVLLSKIFIILSIILVFWVIVLVSGTYLLEQADGWAGLYLVDWVTVVVVVLGVFTVLNIVFLFYPTTIQVSQEEKAEFIQGKRVYEYTYPEGERKGVFSKTYVPVDDKTLIRIKTLIISMDEDS